MTTACKDFRQKNTNFENDFEKVVKKDIFAHSAKKKIHLVFCLNTFSVLFLIKPMKVSCLVIVFC